MKKQLINIEPIKEQIKEKLLEKYNSTTYMNTDIIDVRVDIKELLEEYMQTRNIITPTIYITSDAYIKLRRLVEDIETEVGWYGTVEKMPGLEASYVINDVIVYPQKVTGATCEQDDDKMFEFEMSLTTDQVNHKRFHGHSHVNMGVTPSSVDEQFYKDLLSQVNDYFIIMITNKRENYYIRFYDVEHNIVYTELPLYPILNDGSDIESWVDEEAKKLEKPVTKPVTSTSTTSYSNYTHQPYKQDTLFKTIGKAEEDGWVWDKDYGYIKKSEKAYLDDCRDTTSKTKKGRRRR